MSSVGVPPQAQRQQTAKTQIYYLLWWVAFDSHRLWQRKGIRESLELPP